jgi:hypothetical protein
MRLNHVRCDSATPAGVHSSIFCWCTYSIIWTASAAAKHADNYSLVHLLTACCGSYTARSSQSQTRIIAPHAYRQLSAPSSGRLPRRTPRRGPPGHTAVRLRGCLAANSQSELEQYSRVQSLNQISINRLDQAQCRASIMPTSLECRHPVMSRSLKSMSTSARRKQRDRTKGQRSCQLVQ